jgi:hypothetical protein
MDRRGGHVRPGDLIFRSCWKGAIAGAFREKGLAAPWHVVTSNSIQLLQGMAATNLPLR